MDELSLMMMNGAPYEKIREYFNKKIKEAYESGYKHAQAETKRKIADAFQVNIGD